MDDIRLSEKHLLCFICGTRRRENEDGSSFEDGLGGTWIVNQSLLTHTHERCGDIAALFMDRVAPMTVQHKIAAIRSFRQANFPNSELDRLAQGDTKQSDAKPLTFIAWLRRQRDYDTVVGDLARDMSEDSRAKGFCKASQLLNSLIRESASSGAWEAFGEALRMYTLLHGADPDVEEILGKWFPPEEQEKE